MELDDLKKAWADQPLDAPPEPLGPTDFERLFAEKRRGLGRSLALEAGATAGLLAVVAWLWAFGSIYRGLTSKALIAGAAVFAAISFWRLFRAFRNLETATDFSKNVVASLGSAIEKAEAELRFYGRSARLFFVLMAVGVAFDNWFSSLGWLQKGGFFGLLAAAFFSTGPYLKRLYGQKLEAMRRQLEQFEN